MSHVGNLSCYVCSSVGHPSSLCRAGENQLAKLTPRAREKNRLIPPGVASIKYRNCIFFFFARRSTNVGGAFAMYNIVAS